MRADIQAVATVPLSERLALALEVSGAAALLRPEFTLDYETTYRVPLVSSRIVVLMTTRW